jgi:hypothetical protein
LKRYSRITVGEDQKGCARKRSWLKLFGGAEESHKKTVYSISMLRFTLGPPKYEVEVITTIP